MCVIDHAWLENQKSSNGRKNHEDGSDFDDFRTEKIAETQAVTENVVVVVAL